LFPRKAWGQRSIQAYSDGTMIGVVVALSVDFFGRMIGLPLALQISLSVAVCAVAASGRPTIRVCLWTCPLILVTASSLGTHPGLPRLALEKEVQGRLPRRVWNGICAAGDWRANAPGPAGK
jgi:hypothetical protein